MDQKADLVQHMQENAKAVQTIVTKVGDLHEAFKYTIGVTKEQGGTTIASPGLADPERSALAELCSASGLSLFTENLRQRTGEMHAAFTRADWGVAETATLVIDSTSEDMRLATMLSEIHVALLPASLIRPDSDSLEIELNELMKSSPRYLAFISGASRTADIERVLTIGVHGPKELHILILEDNVT